MQVLLKAEYKACVVNQEALWTSMETLDLCIPSDNQFRRYLVVKVLYLYMKGFVNFHGLSKLSIYFDCPLRYVSQISNQTICLALPNRYLIAGNKSNAKFLKKKTYVSDLMPYKT